MEQMQKLNTMGDVAQPKYGGAQVVNVTYGHNGSGKLYSYYGTNKRAGDIVTPEVTHPKSGKTYKTLAVVRSTHNAMQGRSTMDYLQGKQPGALGNFINQPRAMKWIGQADQKSLPGYYPGWDKDTGKDKDTQAARALKREAWNRDDIPAMQKMNLMREVDKMKGKGA